MITPLLILIITIIIISLWSLWGFLGSRVEQMKYRVLEKIHGYEIREYPEHIVAQTTLEDSFSNSYSISQSLSMRDGFRTIAGYIFGGNRKKESIPMTAPVLSQKIKETQEMEELQKTEKISMTAPVIREYSKNGTQETLSFVMPSSYTLETLPIPNDSRVKLVVVPSKKYAVLGFSGYRSEKRIQKMQERLLKSLAHNGVRVKEIGNITYAGYNPPWTPPWMNRHEVLIEII